MSAAKTAVFRADASPEIGGGHIVRCLTLADALAERGWRCRFAVRAGTLETVPALDGAHHEVLILEPDEAGEPEALADHWPEATDWLIVDHYRRGAAFETACRPWARKIMAIDDLADRDHDCDLLLDQTLGRQAADYANRIAEDCRLLLGPDYALLRPDFPTRRAAALARRGAADGVRRILVSLGASDPHNVTPVVLEGIVQSGSKVEVDVVLGAAAPGLADVQGLIERMPQTARLHVDTQKMAALMAEADLAIGAAGTTSWERCCMGLPALLVVLAENQREITDALCRAGGAQRISNGLGTNPRKVADALRALITEPRVVAEMANRCAAVCDGLGATRALLYLLPGGRSRDGYTVRLRLARPDDEEALLAWQRHPATRRYARDPRPPTADEHHRWLQRCLGSSRCLLTVVEHGGTAVGVLRLDLLEQAAPRTAYEISILIAPEQQGRGLALEALRLARDWLSEAELVAEVLPGNTASQELFKSAGYAPDEVGLLHNRAAQGWICRPTDPVARNS